MESDNSPYKSNREILEEIKTGLKALDGKLLDITRSVHNLEKSFVGLLAGSSTDK